MARFPRREGRYRSRLDEVIDELKLRAIFWNKTSVSVFLSAFAFAGLIIAWQGLGGLASGQPTSFILRSAATANGWSLFLIHLGLTGAGIAFILPLILIWLTSEKRIAWIFTSLLLSSLVIFLWGYLLGYLSAV